MPLLELKSIHKAFRTGFWGVRTPVLRGLDLAIEPGEVYGFLGHNGAGKSTTLKLILGLLRPDAGEVQVFGAPGAGRAARRRIGYLGEEVGVYPHATADEMLELLGRLFRMPRAEVRRRSNELIERVGLADKRALRVRHYSKGMRQRLGLACALMNDPDLLLLDEPYSGLDPIGRKQLRELLAALKTQGKAILMSSHIVPDVEAVCDRVGILSGGCIARVLDLRESYTNPTSEVEVTVSGVDPRRLAGRGFSGRETFSTDSVLALRCPGDHRLNDLVSEVYAAGGRVVEVRPVRSRLEDVFIEAVEGAGSESAPRDAARPEPALSRR